MAATHPDRVSALVLTAAACPGLFDLGDGDEDYLDGIERDWNTGRVLNLFIQHPPDAETVLAPLARFERYCCTPSVAREIMRHNHESDIRDVVPSVSVPTLVVHQRGDPLVPFT